MARHDELLLQVSKYQPLGRLATLSYGVGHMLNDITSACWFTYLLLFLTNKGLRPRCAAIVMLSGQVADGLTTVFVGELIDRLGHFKLWHAGGSFLVALSFSSVFGSCLACKFLGNNSLQLQTIGYSISAAVFNVGWAVTQVSHMSMVNCMTLNSTSRVVLASCRNAFSMVANLGLYAIALTFFNKNSSNLPVEVQYRWIAYSSITVGCFFVFLFLWGTKEPELNRQIQCKRQSRISWSYWFKKVLYYQVALVYTLTRLVTNVSQALLAFYVSNDLGMNRSAKALVPAIIYICSFLVSIILQEMKWTGNRIKAFFTVGAMIWIFCGGGIFFLSPGMHNYMYLLSIAIGAADALMTVTGISMQSILVGEDVDGCAFVYGSFSFADKLSCGFVLYLLEFYQGSQQEVISNLDANSSYSVNRWGLGVFPSACALISVLVTYTINIIPSKNSTTLTLDEPLLV